MSAEREATERSAEQEAHNRSAELEAHGARETRTRKLRLGVGRGGRQGTRQGIHKDG